MTAPAPAADPPYRELLCLVAAGASAATMAELALIGHWHGRSQLMAWLAAWANLSAAWAVARPTNGRQLRAARWLALASTGIAVTGAIIHLRINAGFEAELHPDSPILARWGQAAQGGLPLLAPLSLALPAVLVGLALWHHPDAGPTRGRPGWPGRSRWGTVDDGRDDRPQRERGVPWTTSRFRWRTGD